MAQDERAITPEMRSEGLEILRSDRPSVSKLRELAELLGTERSFDEIAHRLGIPASRIHYWLVVRDRQRRLKAAGKEAASTPGSLFTSSKLGFLIWLPQGWQVEAENDEPNGLGQSLLEEDYRRWRQTWDSQDLGELYKSVRFAGFSGGDALFDFPPVLLSNRWLSSITWPVPSERVVGEVLPFDVFIEGMGELRAGADREWQDRLALKMKAGQRIGYWRAVSAGHGGTGRLQVEVIKRRLQEPLTSLDLYHAEKPDQLSVVAGSRPPHKFAVDGLEAVRYYCAWRDDSSYTDQFSTYMVDDLAGWVIECWCQETQELSLRPLFHRIVSSFRRT